MKKIIYACCLIYLNCMMTFACDEPSAQVSKAFSLIDAKNNSVALKEYLLSMPVGRDVKNEKCETLYAYAIKTRNNFARQILDDLAYNPKSFLEKVGRDNENYFEFSLAHGNIETIKDLKKRGGRISEENRILGFSRLLIASKSNSEDVINYLIESGEDIDQLAQFDSESYSAFHLASRYNPNPKVIKTLLDAGSKVNEPVKKSFDDKGYWTGRTPLMLASSSNNTEVVKTLIFNGANIDDQDFIGNNSLHWAIDNNFRHKENVSLLLINSGINLHLTNNKGNTPLRYACYGGYDVIVSELLKRNARISSQNPINECLYYATIGTEYDLMKNLIEKFQANINYTNDKGDNLLMITINGGLGDRWIDMVNYLLSKKVDMNATNVKGITALMVAVRRFSPGRGEDKIIEALLKNGANTNIRDQQGKLAYDYATELNLPPSLLKLLKPKTK